MCRVYITIIAHNYPKINPEHERVLRFCRFYVKIIITTYKDGKNERKNASLSDNRNK